MRLNSYRIDKSFLTRNVGNRDPDDCTRVKRMQKTDLLFRIFFPGKKRALLLDIFTICWGARL